MFYAANQFDKLICSKNITESEPKRKEKCGHLKVSDFINCVFVITFLFKIFFKLMTSFIE
jgi:hypothetical protein